jgi:hypothetical protein
LNSIAKAVQFLNRREKRNPRYVEGSRDYRGEMGVLSLLEPSANGEGQRRSLECVRAHYSFGVREWKRRSGYEMRVTFEGVLLTTSSVIGGGGRYIIGDHKGLDLQGLKLNAAEAVESIDDEKVDITRPKEEQHSKVP